MLHSRYSNIVYLIKIDRNRFPNRYIGSKSNCIIRNNKIYDSRNNEYFGSSCDPEYKNIVEYCDYEIEILESFDSYEKCLEKEKELHIFYGVVASPEYFNKSIATISNYLDSNYATYKNLETGKIARLPRDHPRVLNNEWVGVTKGRKLSEEHKASISNNISGEKNPFYGKKHSKKTKKLISNKNLGSVRSKEVKLKMSLDRMGIQKKIGRKGFLMLKNIQDGRCIRIKIKDIEKYDLSVWKNPSSIKQKREVCFICGIESTVGNIKRWHNERCKKNEN